MDSFPRKESPPWQCLHDVRLLGGVDIQPVQPQHADLEGNLSDLFQRLTA